jgi:hypothetical protein
LDPGTIRIKERSIMIIQSMVGILVAALLALSPNNIAHANLITNPGFETGDFSGWARSGNQGFTSVTTAPFARSGTFGAALGPIGSDGFLSQAFPTVPGDVYIVSFSLQSDGGLPNDFNASWAGTQFFSQTNIPGGEYLTYTFTEVAPGASTILQFGFRNDPGFLGLDDVVVNPTPEPTTMLLLGTTMAGLGLARWRQWRRRQQQ